MASLIVWLAGWRGSDWPAHLFRVELFDRSGFTVWNPYWYGGHDVPAYSIIFPPLADLVGIGPIAIASTVASVFLFNRLAHRSLPTAATVASGLFCLGMVANLAVGRLPFALGAVFALLALDLVSRHHTVWAIAAAALSSLASPLAGAFLALILAAWIAADLRTRVKPGLPIAAGALVPILFFFELFPESGWFPYRGDEFLGTLAMSAGIAIVAPRGWKEVRLGAVLVFVLALPLFGVPNAIGGNLVRLVGLLGIPIAAAVLWTVRRWLVLLALPLTLWQVGPAVTAFRAPADPAAHAEYFTPLVEALGRTTNGVPARIEIPFTAAHWEAAHAGPDLMLARGWERQIDLVRNDVLYSDDLTHPQYEQWLRDNAVAYVALPDVNLDPGADVEAELIQQRPDYLEFVWGNEHWLVFEVVDARPLLSGPGELIDVAPDRVDFFAAQPGSFELRFYDGEHLAVAEGSGCVTVTDDGWIQVEVATAGYVRLGPVVATDTNDDCPGAGQA